MRSSTPKRSTPTATPTLTVSVNNLAALYSDQGSYAKAESLFLRAWR